MKAVVLAGGKRALLAPYTRILPKPLIPILDVLRQMKRAGIHNVVLTVGHLANLLRIFFLDGSQWGCVVSIVTKSNPWEPPVITEVYSLQAFLILLVIYL